MNELDLLREEINFLDEEIRSLKGRIGATGNSVQLHKLDMLSRLRDRCNRSLSVLAKREKAA